MKKPAKRKASTAPADDKWRMSDLPLHQQVELREALDEARRGVGLVDFDEAMADAEKAVEALLVSSSSSK